MRDTGLANRIRAKAVPVVEVAGWLLRGRDGGGNPVFHPKGSLNHHTAGSASGRTPSLNICIYGREGLEGPLAQVLQSREPDLIDIAYVIASGKANHGGVGSWSGGSGIMDSNYESEGLEVEHTGFGTVHPARLETAARIQAAMLEGSTSDPSMCCQHFEYALPLGRKVDFRELAPFDAHTFRQRVAYWIGRTTSQPVNPDNPFGEYEPGTPPPTTPPPAPAGGYCTVNVRVLRQGHTGGDVRSLQSLLNTKAGQGLVVDGDFGPRTHQAVVNVQNFFHLVADGICGAKTWPTLFL